MYNFTKFFLEALPQEVQDAFKEEGKKKRAANLKKRPGIDYNVPGSGDPLIFYNFPGFIPTKEASGITTKDASGITTKETMGLKKGGVTNAIKKIRGIGMAKGGFKKKTPIY